MALRLAAALALVTPLAAAPFTSPAMAKSPNVIYGYVEHVSANNIKIYDIHQKQTLGFELTPKFDQVFSSDGNTTYQMKNVKAGEFVKLYYDQKALGMRHADRIYVYQSNAENPPSKTQ